MAVDEIIGRSGAVVTPIGDSAAGPRQRPLLIAAAVCVLSVVGVGAPVASEMNQQPESSASVSGTASEPSSASGSEPIVPTGSPSEHRHTPTNPEPVGEEAPEEPFTEPRSRIEVLNDTEGELVSRCMTEAGFPQVAEAQRLNSQTPRTDRSNPLRIYPLDFGPQTKEQAQALGMIGTSVELYDTTTHKVVSKDQSFNSAGETCRAEVADSF